MKAATATVTSCGRVLLSVRLPCGCCTNEVLLDIVEAHRLAAEIYADVVIASNILMRRHAGQWVYPEADA